MNKQYYRLLKEEAKELGVNTISIKSNMDAYNVYNGFTIAYRPSTNLPDNRMIKVAVSYCAPEDEFKKKIGKFVAFNKLLGGYEYIQLPLGEFLRDNGTEELETLLIATFSL